jgi:hypothetical protein
MSDLIIMEIILPTALLRLKGTHNRMFFSCTPNIYFRFTRLTGTIYIQNDDVKDKTVTSIPRSLIRSLHDQNLLPVSWEWPRQVLQVALERYGTRVL